MGKREREREREREIIYIEREKRRLAIGGIKDRGREVSRDLVRIRKWVALRYLGKERSIKVR